MNADAGSRPGTGGFCEALRSSLGWQLYVTGYTLLVGLPLLVAPALALPLLGFEPDVGPWARLAGMFLLSLSAVSYGIYHERAQSLVPYSIGIRAFIALVLMILALSGAPGFLYVMGMIVATGVAGSAGALVAERRTRARPLVPEQRP